MQYATTSDGVRVAYMSLGDGPAIVFASNIFGDLSAYLNGWPSAKETTDRLVNLGWRVILFDVRGMGCSDRNVADVELAGRILDVHAVVAALNLDRFALAGVDIGAATAVAYAVGNLPKVSRLVLLSPWSSGAKYLAIPALRAAYAAEDVSSRDPELFANLLGSVATSFKDVELVRQLTDGLHTVRGWSYDDAADRHVFLLDTPTSPGDYIFLTGDTVELSNWNTTWDGAVGPLLTPNYPNWFLNVSVPAGKTINFKFIKIAANGTVTWENGANHSYTVPTSGTGFVNVNWQY